MSLAESFAKGPSKVQVDSARLHNPARGLQGPSAHPPGVCMWVVGERIKTSPQGNAVGRGAWGGLTMGAGGPPAHEVTARKGGGWAACGLVEGRPSRGATGLRIDRGLTSRRDGSLAPVFRPRGWTHGPGPPRLAAL